MRTRNRHGDLQDERQCPWPMPVAGLRAGGLNCLDRYRQYSPFKPDPFTMLGVEAHTDAALGRIGINATKVDA